jgi:peptidoglycan-associated lipoprotein
MNPKINRSLTLSLTLTAAVLAGCASGVNLDDANKGAPVESRTPSTMDGANSGANAAGNAQSNVATVDLSKNANMALSPEQRTVYFDFDSYVVKDEYRSVVELNAKALNANKAKHLQLEGHTDERGGREYNLALGQKRAEAVQKALSLLGAPANQTEAVSYGEERPADPGHDEAAWAKNRRVELKDR